MSRIELADVSVVYDLLSVEDYNLKRRIVTGLGRKRTGARHDRLVAVDRVSLTLEPGTRLGVIGSNGAGKSTLLRVMAGALPPTHGHVSIDGRVFSLLGGSGAGLDFGLTGLENVIMTGLMLGESASDMRSRMDEIAEFSGLGERLKNPVGTYSSGMQARLRFSILTTLRPQVLIMDEGVATADIAFTRKAKERLDEFRGAAEIMVMSSHSASVKALCDTAIWMEHGAILASGPVEEVLSAYYEFALPTTDRGVVMEDGDADTLA